MDLSTIGGAGSYSSAGSYPNLGVRIGATICQALTLLPLLLPTACLLSPTPATYLPAPAPGMEHVMAPAPTWPCSSRGRFCCHHNCCCMAGLAWSHHLFYAPGWNQSSSQRIKQQLEVGVGRKACWGQTGRQQRASTGMADGEAGARAVPYKLQKIPLSNLHLLVQHLVCIKFMLVNQNNLWVDTNNIKIIFSYF